MHDDKLELRRNRKLRRTQPTCFVSTNMFGAPAEERTVEIPHVEQHDRSDRTCEQSSTIGDANDIAVQKRHTESAGMSSKLQVTPTCKDKRSTNKTDDERGQKHEGKATARADTPGLLKKQKSIYTRRSICAQELRNEADRCVELPHECTREREA